MNRPAKQHQKGWECSLPLFSCVDCCLFNPRLLLGHLLTFLCDLFLFSFLSSLALSRCIPTITLLKAFLLRIILQVHLHFFVCSCLIDFSSHCVLTKSSSFLIECLSQMWLRRSSRIYRRRHQSMIYRHARPDFTRAVKAYRTQWEPTANAI